MPMLSQGLPFQFEHSVVRLGSSILRHMRRVFELKSCCCSSTAPSPNEDASADTVVSLRGSKSASTGLLLISWRTSRNARCCGSSQHHWLSFARRSRRGLVTLAKLGENFPNWLVMPRRRRMSPTQVGVL